MLAEILEFRTSLGKPTELIHQLWNIRVSIQPPDSLFPLAVVCPPRPGRWVAEVASASARRPA
eukprot:3097074-Pyramimonas_sp.AAC.1